MQSLMDHAYCKTDTQILEPDAAAANGPVRWTKRGYGQCSNCNNSYKNSKKPKYCSCGFELGGSYAKKLDTPSSKANNKTSTAIPKSVTIYGTPESGTLRSVATSNSHDREFLFISGNKVSCHAKKCSRLRATFRASRENFHCQHSSYETTPELYRIFSFSLEEITLFTPDEHRQTEMRNLNETDVNFPICLKLSNNSYAVKALVSTGAPLAYTHVKVTSSKSSTGRDVVKLNCMLNSCRKKVGRTKQGQRKKFCVHLHLVALARKLKEGIIDQLSYAKVNPTKDSNLTEKTPKSELAEISTAVTNTILIQKSRKIPLDIHQRS
uniref:Uncharacterized protein n=1 Tax=Clytia hemisphaerica TaxID=252671 RepID=A0A7M6DRU3_9CNID